MAPRQVQDKVGVEPAPDLDIACYGGNVPPLAAEWLRARESLLCRVVTGAFWGWAFATPPREIAGGGHLAPIPPRIWGEN